MRIADHGRPGPAHRPDVVVPHGEPRRPRRRVAKHRPAGGERASRRKRQLQVGTARRALRRNLAHVQRCLDRSPQDTAERASLEQSVSALRESLQMHQTLRTQMIAVLFG